MCNTPCKQCPFRVESKLAYDVDATEALEDGLEPACHAKVGLQNIFAELIPTHRCHGHDEWVQGTPGYQQPAVIKES